jgi:hypothetical protein
MHFVQPPGSPEAVFGLVHRHVGQEGADRTPAGRPGKAARDADDQRERDRNGTAKTRRDRGSGGIEMRQLLPATALLPDPAFSHDTHGNPAFVLYSVSLPRIRAVHVPNL